VAGERRAPSRVAAETGPLQWVRDRMTPFATSEHERSIQTLPPQKRSRVKNEIELNEIEPNSIEPRRRWEGRVGMITFFRTSV
jgi:hypothetical protein